MWAKRFSLKEGKISNDLYSSQGDNKSPNLIMLFAQTDELIANKEIKLISKLLPDATIVGASTGTTVDGNSLNDDGIYGVAIGFEKTELKTAIADISDHTDSFDLGQELGQKLKGDKLAFVYILSDGLNVNGSDIVGGMLASIGGRIPVSGGLAGDGGRFQKTCLINQGKAVLNKVLAIGFYSDKLIVAHGSNGGWEEFGPVWEITKSKANVMEKLGDMRALDLYVEHLGQDSKNLPASGLTYPLRIWHPNYPNHDAVRTLLSINSDKGTLTFAGDVPQGWKARLMRGTNEGLINGAQEAAKHAMANFDNKNPIKCAPSLALLVSCVGRRLLMGSETELEVAQIQETIGKDVVLSGFYSYGEIAPHNVSKLCGLYNQTVTLTLLHEA